MDEAKAQLVLKELREVCRKHGVIIVGDDGLGMCGVRLEESVSYDGEPSVEIDEGKCYLDVIK